MRLLAFEADAALREALKRDLVRKRFGFLSRLRLKPGRRPVRAAEFLDRLHAEPFEGNEMAYADAPIGLSAGEYRRNVLPLVALAERLRAFHTAQAGEPAAGRDGAALVAAL